MFQIESLYKQYKQDIYMYLMSLTHNPTLSEDLLSETFLSAITSIHNFKGNSTIKTWLFSIARHKWLEYMRRSKHDICFDDLASIYLSDNLEDLFIQSDIAKRIKELIDQEPGRTKEIVQMRIDGYSYYEISIKLHISEGSARVIDYRTKRKIKEILKKEGWCHE